MKVAIIGSGISGLYSAYYLKKKYDKNIVLDIYEKKSSVGGRVKVVKFDDIDVIAGAGIGRLNKDNILFSLCREMNVIKNEYLLNEL